jgi:hypothetical protein
MARAQPTIWPDPSGIPVPGFVCGDLRFAAAAPLRSSEGLELGLLVIADIAPRPEFSRKDYETLAELAGVLAEMMELRLPACHLRDAEGIRRGAETFVTPPPPQYHPQPC